MFSYRRYLLLLPLALVILGILVYASVQLSGIQEFIIYEDSHPIQIKGKFITVAEVIDAAGITIRPEDLINPGLDEIPDPEIAIAVIHAKVVLIDRSQDPLDPTKGPENNEPAYTHQQSLASFLVESGELIRPGDRINADGRLLKTAELMNEPLPRQIAIVRHKEVTISDGTQEISMTTDVATIGEALVEAGMRLHAGDTVNPPLSEWLMPGSVIMIERSIPVSIRVDGQTLRSRSQHRDVKSILAGLGVELFDQDYTIPDNSALLTANDQIDVIRVREEYLITEEAIPFNSITQPTGDLDIDQVAIIQSGVPGILSHSSIIRFENDIEINRMLAGDSVIQQPVDEVIGYGTKITIRTLDTPDGPVEYWRVVRMRVTAYSAATSGKDPDHPAYGITASGVPAGLGVVAVDPYVIPFRSYVYVPGYGKGFAGDTGGGVKGRFIDLGFDDGQIETWNGYVDVYYLTPVPAPEQINYMLPSSLP